MFTRFIKVFFFCLITAAFLVFAVANHQTVHLSFFPLPYGADMPSFLFAILCFALGAIIGGFLVHFKLSRTHRLLKAEHKRVSALENELSALQAEQQDKLPAVQ